MNGASAPNVPDYANIGITVSHAHRDVVNAWLRDGGFTSASDIQSLVNVVTYLNGSDPNSNQPSNADYLAINFSGVTGTNVLDFNLSLHENNPSTLADAQAHTAVPLLSLASSVSYIEGNAPVALDPALTVFDMDSSLTEVTLTLHVFDVNQEVLNDASNAGFVVTSTDNDYTLTLTGSKTPTEVENALRAITFEHTGDNPTESPRLIEMTLSDGTHSVTQSMEVTVTGENDAPVISLYGLSMRYLEAENVVSLNPSLSLDDVDSINLQSAEVRFMNGDQTAEESLSLIQTVAGITDGGYDPVSGTLSLSGVAPIADYTTALRAIGYEHTGSDLGNYMRNVEIQITDEQGLNHQVGFSVVGVGIFENVQAYAAQTAGAIPPTPAHYTALNLDYLTSVRPNHVNSYVIGKTFSTVAELETLLATDADGDKLLAYFDDDDTVYNLWADRILVDENPIYVTSEGQLPVGSSLFRIAFTADSDGQSYQFDYQLPISTSSPKHEPWRWPPLLANAFIDFAVANNISGINAGEWNGTDYVVQNSSYRNDFVGATNIDIDLITEFYVVRDYLADQSQTEPEETDYVAMGSSYVTSSNHTQINQALVTDYNNGVALALPFDILTQIEGYDLDGDGLSFAEAVNNLELYADPDGDGLSNAFEVAIGRDAVSTDDSDIFNIDNDNDLIADVWTTDVAVNLDARHAWVMQHWLSQNTAPGAIHHLTPVGAYVDVADAVEIDLSSLSGSVAYEFLLQIDNDAFNAVRLLFPRRDISGLGGDNGLLFEAWENTNSLGVLIKGETSGDLSIPSPYGRMVHLTYVLYSSSETWSSLSMVYVRPIV